MNPFNIFGYSPLARNEYSIFAGTLLSLECLHEYEDNESIKTYYNCNLIENTFIKHNYSYSKLINRSCYYQILHDYKVNNVKLINQDNIFICIRKKVLKYMESINEKVYYDDKNNKKVEIDYNKNYFCLIPKECMIFELKNKCLQVLPYFYKKCNKIEIKDKTLAKIDKMSILSLIQVLEYSLYVPIASKMGIFLGKISSEKIKMTSVETTTIIDGFVSMIDVKRIEEKTLPAGIYKKEYKVDDYLKEKYGDVFTKDASELKSVVKDDDVTKKISTEKEMPKTKEKYIVKKQEKQKETSKSHKNIILYITLPIVGIALLGAMIFFYVLLKKKNQRH